LNNLKKFDIISNIINKDYFMKRFDAVGYNISSNGIVSFYQFHDDSSNSQIEEIYTLKLGEFNIQLIRNPDEKKTIFSNYDFKHGVVIAENFNDDEEIYLGFFSEIETLKFMTSFKESLENHFKERLKIEEE
jgi:uncharacterized alpha/beta hydrolase family protein